MEDGDGYGGRACIPLCLLLAGLLAAGAGFGRREMMLLMKLLVGFNSMVVDAMRTVVVADVVTSYGGVGEGVPAAEENVLAGGEEGEGIEQLFVVHEGFPFGSEVAFPLRPVLVARQVLLAAERLTDAHDVCVVLHEGRQAGPSRWQLVAKEGHDVEDLLIRHCNGEAMVPPGSQAGETPQTHTHQYRLHQASSHG